MSIDPHELDDADLKRRLADEVGGLRPEDLERMASSQPETPTPGEHGRITGRIIGISGPDVFIDIGAKSEGVIPLDEFEPDNPPEIGQALEVIPHGFDSESGLMRLSLREARMAADLETLRIGDTIKARVTGSNIGGLELRVHGIRGFMPMSQVDVERHDDFASFIGHWLECEVTEIDRRGKNLVLSRRKVLEREREELRQQLRYQLEEGQVRTGIVRRLTDFGAFIDLGGIDGLLHVSDISYGRVNHPKDVVKVGDEVEVKILKVDLVKDRISLGLKQLAPDPWDTVEGNYRAGDTVNGRVTKLMNFGAFVELTPGIEGLIPISEMSWTQRVHHPKEVVKEGDHVQVKVLEVHPDKRKISLSLKALAEDPWHDITERYPTDAVVSGAVTKTTNYGAFVALEEGVEGLIHISQLANNRVRAVTDVVKEGEVVQVKVLSVDPQQRRISLSLKGAREAEETAAPESAAGMAQPAKPKKERKRPLRGGLTW